MARHRQQHLRVVVMNLQSEPESLDCMSLSIAAAPRSETSEFLVVATPVKAVG
jgi:hypothetical protein